MPTIVQVNSLRDAMCDSSTVLLCLSRLASGPANTYHRSSSMMRIDVAELLPSESQVAAPVGWGAVALAAADRQQELAWHLSNALGECQALMERHGRFAQVGSLSAANQAARDVLGNAHAASCLCQHLSLSYRHCRTFTARPTASPIAV